MVCNGDCMVVVVFWNVMGRLLLILVRCIMLLRKLGS